MNPTDAYNKVKTILTASMNGDETALNYINSVYAGYRENVPKTMFPCIMLEPVSSPETFITMPEKLEVSFTITIYGILQVYDLDKQIVGDSENGIKGILDFDQDIKTTLGAYKDLEGECEYFEFPDTRFDFTSFPFRQVEIDMRIVFRQNFTNRS